MKKLLLILAAAVTLNGMAQKMTVEAMSTAPMDMSASINQRKDLNGKPCALVKVSMTVANASFGGNVVGDVLRDGSDYWVYLTSGTKMLQVKHPNYKSLLVTFPDYGVKAVEGKQTYFLDINLPYFVPSETVETVKTDPTKQLNPAQPPKQTVESSRPRKHFKPRKIKNYVNAFFPILGMTIGKTTYNDALKLGYRIDDSDDTSKKLRKLNLQGLNFITNFYNPEENLYRVLIVDKIPVEWEKDFGFSFDLSYNEWMELFESLGFRIDELKEPVIENKNGRDVLNGRFAAVAPGGDFYFDLIFDGGEYGTSVDSPGTLCPGKLYAYSYRDEAIRDKTQKTKNKTKGFKSSPAFDMFFPIFGFTPGKTTWADAESAGHSFDFGSKDFTNALAYNLLGFGDTGNKGYFDRISLYKHSRNEMPAQWQKLGFNWGNSYNTWRRLMEDMGFTIVDVTKPRIEKYSTGNQEEYLYARFSAVSRDARLKIDFDFQFGRNGITVDSPGTLNSINFTAQNP